MVSHPLLLFGFQGITDLASMNQIHERNRPWWYPRPSAILATLLVGAALGVLISLDQHLGKGDTRDYGWPLAFQVVPKRADTPPRFYPVALAADLLIAALILASSFFVAQVVGNRRGAPPRITGGTIMLLIAAVALVLVMLRFALILAWLILVTVFLYGLASPVLAIAILLHHAFARTASTTQQPRTWSPSDRQ